MRTDEGERKCQEKTARGNVFRDAKQAKQAASNYTRTKRTPMNWFRCQHCRLYHIGRSRTPDEIDQLAKGEDAP